MELLELFLDEAGVSCNSFGDTSAVDDFVDAADEDEDKTSETKLEHTEGGRDLEVGGNEDDDVDDEDVDDMKLLLSISTGIE